MKLRNIFLLALSFSLIGCGLGNQNVSTLVKIENGFIEGVKEGNLKNYSHIISNTGDSALPKSESAV